MSLKGAAIFLFFFISFAHSSFSQCTTLGQTPATAFPICGLDTFKQLHVPLCTNSLLTVPGCNDGALYSDKNPFYYKFTCYQSGTLGFIITPKSANEDYDWELFDVTGLNPNAIFNNTNMTLRIKYIPIKLLQKRRILKLLLHRWSY